MGLADYLLYRVARNWPSPMAAKTKKLGAEPGSDAYNLAYAQEQFDRRVRDGLGAPVFGCDVLEVGCGHGGISCFLAAAGARSVVGIDVNTRDLQYATRFAALLEERLGGGRLPVQFREMSAYQMEFPPESFDVVVAENTFEHFQQPEEVLRQSFRALRPGGRLLVPIFSSIYSKYGLHLKEGLKLPWANLLFSERTIVRAMQRLVRDRPELRKTYPGVDSDPLNVRDLRRHKDLNDITHARFRAMAGRSGFQILWMRPVATRLGKVIARLPLLRSSILGDVFSIGCSACLRKPSANS